MARMDFTSLFYSRVYDRENLIKSLDSLLSTDFHTLTIIPYASVKNRLLNVLKLMTPIEASHVLVAKMV